MLTSINRYTAIKGCDIYRLDKNGKPGTSPAAIDRDITIGEQTHPSTDVPLMGTISVPDQSRLAFSMCMSQSELFPRMPR